MTVAEATITDRRGCAICSSPVSRKVTDVFDTRFGISSVFSIVRCDLCGLVQTLPRPTPKELQDLYESYYNFGGEKWTSYTNARQKFLSSVFYNLWLRLDGDISFHRLQGRGRLLDVGCNEGRGLLRYRQNGFLAEGLEFNYNAAAEAASAGFTVHTCSLEELKFDAHYEVVVLSNVLEHALDPKGMLLEIYRLMAPGAELWISCPNVNSVWKSIFGRFWINWHVPFHLFHFSETSLETLVKQCGYSVIRTEQETPALWIVQSLIAAMFARRGSPTKQLRSKFIVGPLMISIRLLLFPLLWLTNRLGKGDCLLFRATKQSPAL